MGHTDGLGPPRGPRGEDQISQIIDAGHPHQPDADTAAPDTSAPVNSATVSHR